MPGKSAKTTKGTRSVKTAVKDDLRTKAMIEYERLLELHGAHPLVPRREPMHELISTILSHRTTQKNEDVAYHNMWRRYDSWEAIRDAPVEELTEVLSPTTFPEVKAPYIKKALQRIFEEQGTASIDFLRDLSPEEGLKW